MVSEQDQTISVREAAKRLGLTMKAVYNALWDGRLPAEKIYDRYRIPVSAVEKWSQDRSGVKGRP